MTDYFYMRPVYGPDPPGEQICAYEDQTGAVTTNPFEAYKRHRVAFERLMRESYSTPTDRAGEMFAYWRLPRKMPWHEALPIAQTTPPERVCVLVSPSPHWAKVDFVLPPGVLVKIDQYETTLPKVQRST